MDVLMSPTILTKGKRFCAVVAVTTEYGIGNGELLPWHPKRLQLDMGFLKYITTHEYHLSRENGNVQFNQAKGKNVVIMGRKTWDSIPLRFKPMKDRINIILTRDSESLLQGYDDFVKRSEIIAAKDLQIALDIAEEISPLGQIFILGGSKVYEEALRHPNCECLFLTRLIEHPPMPCTVFFPHHLLLSFDNKQNITRICHTAIPTNAILSTNGESRVQEDYVQEDSIKYLIEVLHK